MRNILIVGTGQSGMYLAHCLRQAGYHVRLVGGHTPEEIRDGRPAITQMSFPLTRAMEEKAGLLSFAWRSQAPELKGVELSLRPPGAHAVDIAADWSRGPGLSIDRSVKIADWLAWYCDVDQGQAVTAAFTTEDLDYMARAGMYDLIVVASGDSELGHLFEADPSRSAGARTRCYAQAFVEGVTGLKNRIRATSSPAGEVYLIPVLTTVGAVTSVMMAGRPGSSFDCFSAQDTRAVQPDKEVWRRIRARLDEHVPDFAEMCRQAELVEGPATLMKRIDPVARTPVGVLPSGGLVLGMADAVLTSDPVSCQGWGNSTRCAEIYFEAIVKHGMRPFDRAWMEQTYHRFWSLYGIHSSAFSTMIDRFWDGSAEPHYLELAQAAPKYPRIQQRWIDDFDDPSDFANWLYDPGKARAYLAEVTAA
ncbi:styrene monooxygenase/indole monooxygenase family protein [Allosalinactinospora lopnorensis]|uniref:styrene monooxygenase/indole monooxygenase family protein n=1 Tax=Allosalinactinospora lopnorensis TaxID=1352348 RepID=UPI000623C580|nr:styrene monooxygenase/indole monooxygenase family protein [Allosalinactinospora lopnorensis]